MDNIKAALATIDWDLAAESLHAKGYAIIPGILTAAQCKELIAGYDHTEGYRKTVVMERYRYGLGEYKYFSYPLPQLLQTIREQVYPNLAPIANRWMEALKINTVFPDTFSVLQSLCHNNNQLKSTVLILKYGKTGYNALHQDLYGDIFFPIQSVLFLNEPGEDYTGGEFVLTEQTPRAQSKAIVLKPGRGEMLLFTTNFRPVKGSKGYHRVNMKHGVSEVHEGQRHTIGIIFHDALS